MSAEFWLGLAVIPTLALVIWVVLLMVALWKVHGPYWKPYFIGDENRRASHAAALAVAKRVLVIKLPRGRVLCWRSISARETNSWLVSEANAYDVVRNALLDAGDHIKALGETK